MEKKGNRNLQPSSRGLSTDSKKNQDGNGGKVWPRGCRHREPAGSSLSTKSEPSRKPQPQRVKSLDKRPKPRGGFPNSNAGAVARTTPPRLENADTDGEPELGSVFLPGSKKQSLNHLLNFVYTPYTPRDHLTSDGRVVGGSALKRYATGKKHRYSVEHFLQANCQFVVNDKGDYRQYMNNPDALVDWDLVEQVILQVSEFPSCPICLYPPVAAKMTRCGHIYCWSCILHYLALSDEVKRTCPICHELKVNKFDLKSVVTIPHSTFSVTETITFKLMKRAKGSLIAYPADINVKDTSFFNVSYENVSDIYSKLLLANQNDILSIIDREDRELQLQLKENKDTPEICFITEAIKFLNERRDKVLTNCANCPSEIENSEKAINEINTISNLTDNLNIIDENNENAPKYQYFYQASDGQHIYLNAINAKMLEHTYGSLEFSPKSITGKILDKEVESMTEELRKRFRYLQHLPVTCQFEIAEIQLNEPIVSRETLAEFKDQIESRRKKRQRRAKEEKRREKRIIEEENRKMGKFPTPNLHLDSQFQFPDFNSERFRNNSESTQPSERSSSPDFSSTSGSLPNEFTYAGPSFARMLATEKKKQPAWPGLKPSDSAPAIPVKLITVTGSNMKSKTANIRRDSDEENGEDYEPVPAYNQSFGDALARALSKEEIEVEENELGCRKKKKKNKKKVLFTTNMTYSG